MNRFGLPLLILWSLFTGGTPAGAAERPAEVSPLDKAFAALAAFEWGHNQAVLQPIEDAVLATRLDTEQRRCLEQRLAACLETNAPLAAKQFACRKLSLIGTEASVPALAPLLLRQELSHAARLSLERIPGEAANRALRDALPRVEDRLKIGLIGSIGAREDVAAVPALIGLLKGTDAAVAGAAAGALGRIATPEAARALGGFRSEAPPPLKAIVTDAWVLAAEQAARRGRLADAVLVYRQLYTARAEPRWRLAGFRGLVLTEPQRAPEYLQQALAGEDDRLRALAARLIAESPSRELLSRFLGLFRTLPRGGQLALLDVVYTGRDVAARPVLRDAIRSEDAAVRLAALRALGLLGDAADLPALLELAAAERGDETQAARAALVLLPGKEVDSALASMLASATPPVRAEAIHSLTARGDAASIPRVAGYLADPVDAVRTRAWEAVTALGSVEQIPTVIDLLKRGADERQQDMAQKALQAILRRVRVAGRDSVLAGLEGAEPAARGPMLRALRFAADSKSLQAVRDAARDPREKVRDAAVRVLAEWPTTEAAPDLSTLARNADKPVWRALAFRGYVRLGRETSSAEEKRRILADAAGLAASAEEKRSVIAAVAELPDPAALVQLLPFLDDPNLAEEAGVAILKVAGALDAKHAEVVVPALQKVLRACKTAELRTQACQHLQRLSHNSREPK